MNKNTIVLIVIAVAALLLVAALIVVATRVARRRRAQQAEQIREQAKLETARVERREALAAETAAKARAAQGEAEAKAAEAARLQDRAATHQSEAARSREELQEQWKHADHLDPATKADAQTTEGSGTADPDRARSGEVTTDAELPRRGDSTNYRDTDSHPATSS